MISKAKKDTQRISTDIATQVIQRFEEVSKALKEIGWTVNLAPNFTATIRKETAKGLKILESQKAQGDEIGSKRKQIESDQAQDIEDIVQVA